MVVVLFQEYSISARVALVVVVVLALVLAIVVCVSLEAAVIVGSSRDGD